MEAYGWAFAIRSVPRLEDPIAYQSWIVPLSVELVLCWPFVVWAFAFVMPGSPVAVAGLRNLLIGVAVAATLTPFVTLTLRRLDQR